MADTAGTAALHRIPGRRSNASLLGLTAVAVGSAALQYAYGEQIAHFVFGSWSVGQVSAAETAMPGIYAGVFMLAALLTAVGLRFGRFAPQVAVMIVVLLWSPVFLHAKLASSRAVWLERGATAQELAARTASLDASSTEAASASGLALARSIMRELVFGEQPQTDGGRNGR